MEQALSGAWLRSRIFLSSAVMMYPRDERMEFTVEHSPYYIYLAKLGDRGRDSKCVPSTNISLSIMAIFFIGRLKAKQRNRTTTIRRQTPQFSFSEKGSGCK
eukprot:scaffold6026_cov163-Amphora_coffeaeformis.AAC.10